MLVSAHLRKRSHSQQQGYVLIVMLLFFVLLAISMTAAAPAMMQRIRRDREGELIHRGKQYARAIKLYYRKFGRYPVRLEDLEGANNVRFLRRRYKDPMTPGGEWRLIHYGEAQLTMPNNPLLPGATAPGAAAGAGPGTVAVPGVAGPGASSSFANTFSAGSSTFGQNNATQGTGTTSGQASGAGSSTESSQSGQSGQSGQPGTPAANISSPLGTGPQFGGGPVVGVASTSKKESIKQLNQKNHYNDWEFVYDPRLDLGAMQAVQQVPGVGNQPNAISPGVQVSPGLGSPGMPGMQQPGSTR